MNKKLITFTALFSLSFCLFASPKIERWKSANGATVVYSQVKELPILDIRIIFAAGASRDNNLPGIASITNSMLSEGAAGKSANQLSEIFDSQGINFSSGSARDMGWLDIRTVTDQQHLNTAITQLNQILTQPDFPEDAIQRLTKQMQIGLRQKKQSPGAIAREQFYKAVYGSHPYGIPPQGTEESIKQFSREKIIAFYKKYYVAANATVAIVGDVDRKEAQQIIDKIFNNLPQGKHAETLPVAADLKKGEKIAIEFDSEQTHIFIGQPGIRKTDKEYFPLVVGNHILGGNALLSILGEEVRKKRGLAYSVYSHFSPMLDRGPFIIGCQTQNSRKDESLKTINKYLREFIKNGPTEKQLTQAKMNLSGSFPLGFASNSSIAGWLGNIGFYNMPLDYLDSYQENINKVTKADIIAAFQKALNPEKMITVTVGR